MEGSGSLRCGALRAAGGLLPGAVRLQSANQQDVEPLEHGQFEANSGHQRVSAHWTSRPYLVHSRMRNNGHHRSPSTLCELQPLHDCTVHDYYVLSFFYVLPHFMVRSLKLVIVNCGSWGNTEMGGSKTTVTVARGAARPNQVQYGNQWIQSNFRWHALCTLWWRLESNVYHPFPSKSRVKGDMLMYVDILIYN